MNYTCIGSGAFGMAIASIIAAKKNNHVTVWTHDEKWMKETNESRKFTVAKREYPLPNNISISTDFEQCINESNIIFLLVSTPFIKDILQNMKRINLKNKYLFIGTKGMLDTKPYFLTDYFKKELNLEYVGFFAGPNLAQDMLLNDFCSITFSAKTKKVKNLLREAFSDKVIIHFTKNRNSLELASVMKNIYAIGAGILIEKHNSKSVVHAYLAQSYSELIRLINTYFLLDYDFIPIDITGDFYLTCTMEESRNQRYGRAIIQGNEQKFLKENTVEGVENMKNVYTYLQKKEASAPLFYALYNTVILKENSSILEETMYS